MKRREFVTLLAGAVILARPLAARAQAERVRRVGLLGGTSASNVEGQKRQAAFLTGLKQLGWIDGTNVRIDVRWGGSNPADISRRAAELVALAPDVLVAIGSTSLQALLQYTRTVPIVFAIVPDPVGAGFVASLSKPGGNATGFMMFEYSLAGNGSSCSKRSRPRSGVRRCCEIRRHPPASASSRYSKPYRRQLVWKWFQSVLQT